MIAVAIWLVETVFMMIGALVVGAMLSESLIGILIGVALAALLVIPAVRRLPS